MPLILASNSITGGYTVDNSCRFDDGSSDNLSKTFSTTGTSSFKATISLWLKRSNLGSKFVFGSYAGSPSVYSNDLYFTSGDALEFDFGNASQYALVTNQLFRDVSAWYHIVIAIDTTQATSSDRVKMYVNGTQITSFSTANYPTQNSVLMVFKNNNANRIGSAWNVGSPFDGYISEFVNIDGQQLDPTSFGEFDEDTGIWKPIDVSGLTFGTNGFYLDFENSGSLGADVSGNGNNFTVNNLTSIDQTTDTPTLNYCTMNPLQAPLSSITSTFADGNLSISGNNADWQRVYGTIGVKTGKWFYEWKCTALAFTDNRIGWDSIDFINDGTDNYYSGLTLSPDGKLRGGIKGYVGYDPNEVQMTADYSGGNFSFTTNDILGMAIDIDNNTFSVYKNGNLEINAYSYASYSTNNSVHNNKGYFISPSMNFYSSSGNSNTGSFNFGNPPFTISSGNSDANGYGNFEYAVPSGYYALNTKNLSEFG